MVKFSIWSGAKLAGASERQLHSLNQFADCLGLAFQIADDLLDESGSLTTLGKTPGKDQAAHKATWLTVFGAQKAKEKLIALEEEGLAIVANAGLKQTLPLKELLKYAIHRQK